MGKVKGKGFIKRRGGTGKQQKDKKKQNARVGANHHGNKKKKKHTWKSVRDKNSGSGNSSKIPTIPNTRPVTATTSTSSSTLRTRMLERLSVARFRTLNADIDSTPASIKNQKKNPLTSKETFESYHTGFATATSSWKQNPLDLISEWIRKSVPPEHVIADFGCGAGKLAKSVPNVTHSFDLHRLEGADHVVECDMGSVPLQDHSVHVAVFCLSLMGSDVTEYLLEARRVLVDGGRVKIAEAAARLTGDNMRKFCTGMHSIGFKKTAVEEIGGGDGKDHVFVLMEFKKLGGWGSSGNGKSSKKSVVLGACVYKKR